MRITPIDIRKQEFRKSMRGYDPDEVNTFLSMVADEMEELVGTAQQTRTEVTSLNERLAEYRQMEDTMRETLATVQKAAEEKRRAADKEADMVLKEAEMKAGNWIEDAHKSIRDIKRELVKLRGMRDSYVTRLRMLVQAQLDMLKLAEVEEETPEESLDLFEEKLEELTTRARERVERVEGDVAEEPELEPVEAGSPAGGMEGEEEELVVELVEGVGGEGEDEEWAWGEEDEEGVGDGEEAEEPEEEK